MPDVQPTNNPVPSDHPADARDNFKILDEFVNSRGILTSPSRTGRQILTLTRYNELAQPNIDGAEAAAVSAAASAAAAEAAVSGLDYQGLWPDSGGSADKGDTYQTQVSGTATGQYFTALQNTTVDPVGDNVNWREVVGNQSFGGVTNYQAASVDGVRNSRTLSGQVISETMIDTFDVSISTQGYHGGWAAQVDAPQGGAEYLLTTIQRVRDSKGDAGWGPDGVGDFYLAAGDGQTYVAMLNSELGISVAQFGARFDYNTTTNTGTDDTQAFNDALAYYDKVSPAGRSGWGIGTIFLPRGNALVNGTINRPSLIGLKWKGQGQNVTNIHTNIDQGGAMFEMNLLIQVSFEDILFNHVAQNSDKSTWTRDLFKYDGAGGGRNLSVKNCEVFGFNRVVHHVNTINEDTTDMDHCTFNGCRVFLESENTQAVVNTYSDCTWVGISDSVFYVAGQQQTKITSGNVVCDATFIRYKNISGKGTPNRGFNLTNVKFEWTSGNSDPAFQPKIIDADGSFIVSYIRMVDCAITGGPTPDPLARWANLGAGIHKIIVEGGAYDGIIEVAQSNSPTPQRLSSIMITDTIVSDPATWKFTETGSGSFPEVAFFNARNGASGSKNPINHTIKNKAATQFSGPVMIEGKRTVVITKADSVTSSFFGGTSDTVSYEFFGQRFKIESIRAVVTRTSDASNKTFTVYGDAAKTSLIGQFTPTDVAVTDGQVYTIPITAANSITSDGLYCEVDNPATTISMYFSVDIVAI